ncbi:hypothetical protein SAMN05216257_105141 [Meinhardsimonia xiamenensis]|jgi:hypothetical protein|uniref:Uncharacterized protein n=1 Tax=Meinhardsimonia xiamenensis TaxID=990712 RepID=A0A1G9FDE5_9RHOB|nr:hypothetical protein [Meinhardsimonia xiamenensis]PRX37892.1 hypothetical protein LV81_00162 [Meinhardsimonia xiamenensis]SDK86435.1 hypothetical protein SAMN05216257_105141 [Meinhardsimonia xiamenensis]
MSDFADFAARFRLMLRRSLLSMPALEAGFFVAMILASGLAA